jgi:hypothetical protein
VKITLESSPRVAVLDGVQARIWRGQLENGTPVVAFIHRIAVPTEADVAKLELELEEMPPPSTPPPPDACAICGAPRA